MHGSSSMNRTVYRWLLLFAVCSLLFFYKLEDSGLAGSHEARAGLVVRAMNDSGEYLTVPSIYGDEAVEKPIFYYWLVMLSGKIFGLNEFGIRLPSAVSALLLIVLIVPFGHRLYGPDTGFLAAFILAVSIGFEHLARVARIDMTYTALLAAAMYCFYRGYFEGRQPTSALYVFYLLLGVSVLTKGPLGMVILGGGILLYALAEKNFKMLWEIRPISGALIVIAVAVPWYLYMNAKTEGAFFREFLLLEHLEKFTGTGGHYASGTDTPLWYYVPQLLVRFLPWSIFLPFGLWWLRRNRKKISRQTWLLVAWFGFSFVFLSIADFKRADYLLPLYPPLALMTARYLVYLQGSTAGTYELRGIQIGVYVLAGIIAVLSVAAVAFVLSGQLERLLNTESVVERFHSKDLAAARAFSGNILSFVIVIMGFLGAVVLAARFLTKRLVVPGAYTLVVAMVGLFLYVNAVIDPILDKFYSYRDFTLRLAARIGPADRVAFHQFRSHEIQFYLARPLEGNPAPETLNDFLDRERIDYLISRTKHYEALPAYLKRRLPVVDKTWPGSHRSLYLSQVVKTNG